MNELGENPYELSPKTKWFGPTTTGVMLTEEDNGLILTVSDLDTLYTMVFEVRDGILVKTHDMGEPL